MTHVLYFRPLEQYPSTTAPLSVSLPLTLSSKIPATKFPSVPDVDKASDKEKSAARQTTEASPVNENSSAVENGCAPNSSAVMNVCAPNSSAVTNVCAPNSSPSGNVCASNSSAVEASVQSPKAAKQSEIFPISSIVSQFAIGEQGAGMTTAVRDFTDFYIFIIVNESRTIMKEYGSILQTSPAVPDFSPSLGELVCAFSSVAGEWSRAYVTNVEDKLVCFVDLGWCEAVEKMKSLPKTPCAALDAYGCRCLLLPGGDQETLASLIESNEIIKFRVTARKRDALKIEVNGPENSKIALECRASLNQNLPRSLEMMDCLPFRYTINNKRTEAPSVIEAASEIRLSSVDENNSQKEQMSSVESSDPVAATNCSGFFYDMIECVSLELGQTYQVLPVWFEEDALYIQLFSEKSFSLSQQLMSNIADHCVLSK